jgi:hypothetical protein
LAFSDSDQLRNIQRAESEVLSKIRNIISLSPPQRVKEKYEWLDIEVQKILTE